MLSLLIQLVVGILLFSFASETYLRIYKKVAYLLYPVGITCFIVLAKNDIQLNENYGVALDITGLFSSRFVVVVCSSILLQFLFSSVFFKFIKEADLRKSNR